MPTFDIIKWDVMIPKGNDPYMYPLVYIRPGESFADYAKKNSFTVKGIVQDSGSQYDGIPVVSFIHSEQDLPRPAFSGEKDVFGIVLSARWLGYPKNNGKIELEGVYGENRVPVAKLMAPTEFKVPIPWEFYDEGESRRCQSMSTNDIILLLLFIIVLGFLVMVYSDCKKK
jgi:hypothetical protein